MIAVSDAWKNAQPRFILPETFVEITCAITETGAQKQATSSGENEAVFSDVEVVAGNRDVTATPKYATFEHNLWALDGSRGLLPAEGPYVNTGYVSADASIGKVTLTLSEPRTVAIAGITIVWSTEFEEYPLRFAVTVKNGDTVIGSTLIEDNASSTSLVDLEVNNYDTVEVEVYDWCLPNRRFRVERVYLGHIMTFTKNDIFSYTHEQTGSLNSAELPKNSISFTVNNIDGRWNPNNPQGLARYLSERQRVTVRYGLDLDGTIEWIPAGVFYLSEWTAPANGLEASFVARDRLEFLLYEQFGDIVEGASLESIVKLACLDSAVVSAPDVLKVDPSLRNYTASVDLSHTKAEVIQMCANAACCVIRYDRDGVLNVEPLKKVASDYVIPTALSYSHPETSLSRPLRAVTVSYGEAGAVTLSVGASGELQTVVNPFISDEEQAIAVGLWVRDTLEPRKTIGGEFRGDPRLDLFDIVEVQSKYGSIFPVVIESITYNYTGSFKANYVGRVIYDESIVAASEV